MIVNVVTKAIFFCQDIFGVVGDRFTRNELDFHDTVLYLKDNYYAMKIAITGAGGFIGTALGSHFRNQGHEVISIPRSLISEDTKQVINFLEGVHVVVNLAGAPILSRWTHARKDLLFDSRILTTSKLSEAIDRMQQPPALFLSGSAIGIYRSDGSHDESSNALATDFLGKLCREWEYEASRVSAKTRVVFLRTGVVLGRNGGALKPMLTLFRRGLGGRIASGKQPFSWIHMDDLVRAVDFIVGKPELNGPVNLVSPNPATNLELTKTLCRILHRPAILPVPEFMLRLIFRKGAEALTKGQNVLPGKLNQHGFIFAYPQLAEAIANLIST